ncbi:gastrula zinc finger protein 5-1-like isoform X2 [Pleurodeles waltl]|uniref:gastrula zinc finger protein 5-1-like isoform X2 n=1 Tax=Pleurodeles waltl TaxID=8319 RepID=UPI003709489D
MFQQGSDKVPDKFHDAAAYFCEDEWKLLHEWQKELYNSVMKEIHQALISLGPLITTTVFSLREKEKDALHHVEEQDRESWQADGHSPGVTTAGLAVPLNIKGEGNKYQKDPQDKDQREYSDYLASGPPFIDVNTSVKINRRQKGYSCYQQEANRTTSSDVFPSDCYPAVYPEILLPIQDEQAIPFNNCPGSDGSEIHNRLPKGVTIPNADMCWRKEAESKSPLVDHNSEGEQRTTPSFGHEVISFIVKDEEETSSLGQRDAKSRGSIKSGVECGESVNRQQKERNSIRHSDKRPAYKGSARPFNIKVPWVSEKKKYPRSQLWSQSFLEFRGEKTDCQTSISNPAPIDMHHSNPTVVRSETYDESQSIPENAAFLPCLTETPMVHETYTCIECGKRFHKKGELIRHFRTHTSARPYACTECKKSFFKKGDFTRHRRTHTGEKPFTCADCHKSFNRKGNLDQHRILIHSGVRPFKCSECEKCFSRQCHLTKHMMKHRKTNTITFPNNMM